MHSMLSLSFQAPFLCALSSVELDQYSKISLWCLQAPVTYCSPKYLKRGDGQSPGSVKIALPPTGTGSGGVRGKSPVGQRDDQALGGVVYGRPDVGRDIVGAYDSLLP